MNRNAGIDSMDAVGAGEVADAVAADVADGDATGRADVHMHAHGVSEGRFAGRRGLGAAVVACLLGAGLTLFANSATWVHAEVRDTAAGDKAMSAPLDVALGGGDLAPAVSALGLVGLAAAVALLATRGVGRRVVGVLVALAGVGVLVVAARIGFAPEPAVRTARHVVELVPSGRLQLGEVRGTAAPWVTAVGGLAFVAAGLLAALFGARWPGMGGRYQARAHRPMDDWEAIERGHDPTSSPDVSG